MARKLFIVLAVLFATLTTVLTYLYLHKIEKTHVVELCTLVVASTDIEAYSVATEGNIKTIEVPTQSYPVGGISEIDDVMGQKLKLDLPPETPILQPMLAKDVLPKGMRAIAVPCNIANSVAFTLKQGDKVDVLVTVDNATQIIAQNVLVLEKVSDAQGKPQAYVIQVTPDQTLPITLAQQKGDVHLVLRSTEDTEQVAYPPVREKELIK